jgi:hypothetical protein
MTVTSFPIGIFVSGMLDGVVVVVVVGSGLTEWDGGLARREGRVCEWRKTRHQQDRRVRMELFGASVAITAANYRVHTPYLKIRRWAGVVSAMRHVKIPAWRFATGLFSCLVLPCRSIPHVHVRQPLAVA